MLEVNRKKIKCPIFSAKEGFIQELSRDIWREDLSSGEITNKACFLWSEANFLANCSKYRKERFECKICRAIAELRRNAAGYMIGSGLQPQR